jgi:hypothetical protein
MLVPAWAALCVWFVAWTALAWLSMGLLRRVRPGERVPMRQRFDGAPAWRVSPAFAAVFTPALAFVVGLFTIVVGFRYGGGQAPATNVLLAAVFVAAHWIHITMAMKALEKERG